MNINKDNSHPKKSGEWIQDIDTLFVFPDRIQIGHFKGEMQASYPYYLRKLEQGKTEWGLWFGTDKNSLESVRIEFLAASNNRFNRTPGKPVVG